MSVAIEVWPGHVGGHVRAVDGGVASCWHRQERQHCHHWREGRDRESQLLLSTRRRPPMSSHRRRVRIKRFEESEMEGSVEPLLLLLLWEQPDLDYNLGPPKGPRLPSGRFRAN